MKNRITLELATNLLKKLKNTVRQNKRKSLPGTPNNLDEAGINISFAEAELLSELNGLKINPRFIYELSEHKGRPSLKVTDRYIEPVGKLEIHFVTTTDMKASGYDAQMITMIVHQLTVLQEVQQSIKALNEISTKRD